MSLFSELRRRNVLKVALLYAVASLLIVWIVDHAVSGEMAPIWAKEFVLLLPETNGAQAVQVAEQLRAAVEEGAVVVAVPGEAARVLGAIAGAGGLDVVEFADHEGDGLGACLRPGGVPVVVHLHFF